MKKIQIFFIVIAVLILGAIITVSTISSKNRAVSPNQEAGKYDAFATCIKDKGATFYGAFWCPHCNNNKELFGSSKNLIPYVECSTPDGTGQLPICKDNGIEGYPAWTFANPMNFTETTEPIVCTKAPGKAGEDSICDRARSAYATVWIFPGVQISSVTEPVHVGNVWTFAAGSQLRGEVQLATLAEQTGCVLPQ